jgi:PAS domain S-box-containing protein
MDKDNNKNEEAFFLQQIIDNVPNMIFVKDAKELRFVLLNKVGEEIFGNKKENVLGKNDYDFFPKDQAEFFIKKDREVLETKKLIDIPEELIQVPGGSQRILHTRKIPILDAAGNPRYLLGLSEDITNRKNTEKELSNKVEELEKMNKIMLDRELKMVELKKEIEDLKNKINS